MVGLLGASPAAHIDATRHILATDFRVGFFNQIDVLLDEKVLIGQGSSTAAGM